jgi:hypothetical protein
MTKRTKALRWGTWILTILSVLCLIAPPAYFVIVAAISSTLVIEKLALAATVMVVLILTVIAAVNKLALRSRLWILLIGLYFVLDSFMTPLIVIAICQVLDELVITPLKKFFKDRYTINKEIDRR